MIMANMAFLNAYQATAISILIWIKQRMEFEWQPELNH